MELRITGAGHSGRQGGPTGDLYLAVTVAPHPLYDRRGSDLVATLDIAMTQAALGTELEVPTLEGSERVRIAPGTQSGTVVRLRGKGVPNLGRRGRGDVLLDVQVSTPEKLRKEERAAIERLAQLRQEPVGGASVTPARLRRPDR
jgi:molecular chaperone DnaJ